MDKLDRLGWAAGLAFVSYGARIGIRVTEPAVLERLSALLPPGSVRATSPVVHDLYSLVVGSNGESTKIRRYSLLYAGSAQLARTMDLGEVLEALEEHLHLLVALRAPRKLFVRGGVVGWRDRAIVVPGDRPAEVSPMVAMLVRAGATYYSDKYAVLDERGRVHPYVTPFVEPDANDQPDTKTPAESPIDRNGRRPLPVGLIAIPATEPETLSSPRALSRGQAVLALLGQTVASRLRPVYALKTLERAVASATTLEIPRGHPPLLD